MAIAFVNGTTAGNASAGNLVVSYSSTSGNSLFLAFASSSGAPSQVQDSNGNTWIVLLNGGGSNWGLAYRLNSPAISSVTITAASGVATNSAALGEYSGVISTIGSVVSTLTTVSPWSVSKTLTASTNWFIAGGGMETLTNPTVGANTGNIRETGPNKSDGTNIWTALLVDNTGAGSVTCSANISTAGASPTFAPTAIEAGASASGGAHLLACLGGGG